MTDIIKLSDNQSKVLTAAAEREDGAVSVPEKMKAAAANKVAQALIERKLMREIRAKPGMPVWRRDDEARCFSLVIMSAGRKALEMQTASALEQKAPRQKERKAESVVETPAPSDPEGSKEATSHPSANTSTKTCSARVTKKSEIIALLQRPEGASLEALIAATGWLSHTTRAALTGLRKSGYEIERRQEKGLGSIYRIILPASSEAA
ncbi:MAG: DUF3489 domain-containing protein [Beijerinckiaceae bacterium]|nr:MAG: DUF3489 domain-containing protein [Beijerinckiaceae bacterium]